jgi:hypothetical protein
MTHVPKVGCPEVAHTLVFGVSSSLPPLTAQIRHHVSDSKEEDDCRYITENPSEFPSESEC